LDTTMSQLDFPSGNCESNLKLYDLDTAERDGTLLHVGSVFSAADGRIRDSLREEGPRVVSFHNVLKWGSIPLAEALVEVLHIVREGLGAEADIEFAVDMGEGRSNQGSGQLGRQPSLNILQIRPMTRQGGLDRQVRFKETSAERILCRTTRSLGHGVVDAITDVIYVTTSELSGSTTPAVAKEVGELNAMLRLQKARYLLIGPGRWGTSDPSLGIPVEWSQISDARIIVETAFGDRSVDPSQGTHFFHNITSKQIGYLTLSAYPHRITPKDFIDREWLDGQPGCFEGDSVRHVRLDRPLLAYLDGRKGHATILKPDNDDEFDERAPEERY
ncbi:MAG: hypothetical protein CME06_11630, partial [Gemmatimonadetes bacterium]|nr:hypothetical protein [Gemmatimonadota bacterium]